MFIKDTIRLLLNYLHLDLTKNLEYDRLTKLIMKKVIQSNSNCIDIGCHKGEILDEIVRLSPNGKHFAFEPIPYLYNQLIPKFKGNTKIYPFALSDTNGNATFQWVKNAPAYSGLIKRKYEVENPEIEEINVEVKTLDEIIPSDQVIHFIKIDVEGGEFGVLKGAENLLKKNLPIVVFECGLGASDYYGTQPTELYKFITKKIGLKIFTLKSFINKEKSLSEKEFNSCYISNKEYYFIAAKSN